MTSLRLRLIGGMMRPVARRGQRRAQAKDPDLERAGFERFTRIALVPPRGVLRLPEPGFFRFGHPALWLDPGQARRSRAILHFHGGAFVVGSPRTHWKLAGHLGRAAGVKVLLPPYRLAPEFGVADAVADARAAWDFLLARGLAPGDIAIGGDSAGAGLALSLLSGLLEEGTPPACAYLWSPFADHSFSGASVRENAASDYLIPAGRLHELPGMILGGLDPLDPRISPLFASFPSPPPVLIQASQIEILRDDAVRLAGKLRDDGGEVTLELEPDVPHAWHLFHGWFPEAGAAVTRTGAFIRRHLAV